MPQLPFIHFKKLVLILLICILGQMLLTGTASAAPAGYNLAKQHDITGSPDSDLSYYQVKLVLYNTTGVDTGVNCFLGSTVQSDWDDLRFNQTFNRADQNVMLPYWIEWSNATANSVTVWVRMQNIFSNNTSGYMIYYNNSAATSYSNGTDTFPFYEPFDTLDMNIWSSPGGTQSVSEGVLNVTNTGSGVGSALVTKANKTSSSTVVRSRMKINQMQSNGAYVLTYPNARYANGFINTTGNKNRAMIEQGVGWSTHYETLSIGNYYVFETIWNGTSLNGRRDDGTWNTWDKTGAPTDLKIKLYAYTVSGTTDGYFDWVLTRNYTTNEPTQGAYTVPPVDIPVLYYNWTSDSGDTVADSSMYHNDGVNYESTVYADDGVTYRFFGTQVSYLGIVTPTSGSLNASELTIEAIIKTNKTNNFTTITHKRVYGNSGYWFGLGQTGKLYHYSYTGGVETQWDSNFLVADGETHHVVVTHNATNVSMYVDGEMVYAQSGEFGAIDPSSSGLYVSSPNVLDGGGHGLFGNLYYLKIYNKALLPDQITTNYNAESWRLDEVVAPTANFTATPTTGTTPLTVTFNGSISTGSTPLYYNWSFGDLSENSTDATPTHTYDENGTYTVILTVTNEAGSDSTTLEITVTDAPASTGSAFNINWDDFRSVFQGIGTLMTPIISFVMSIFSLLVVFMMLYFTLKYMGAILSVILNVINRIF